MTKKFLNLYQIRPTPRVWVVTLEVIMRLIENKTDLVIALWFVLSASICAGIEARDPISDLRLSSAAHLGFAVESSASTGFKNVGGTMFFLDLAYPLSEDLDIGLRTIGSGGHQVQGEFYRLAAGPLISYEVFEEWYLQLSVDYFSENKKTTDGLRDFRSRGASFMIGWERLFKITKEASLGWTGFISRYSGNLEAMNALPPTSGSQYSGASSNVGGSQGVAVALKINL